MAHDQSLPKGWTDLLLRLAIGLPKGWADLLLKLAIGLPKGWGDLLLKLAIGLPKGWADLLLKLASWSCVLWEWLLRMGFFQLATFSVAYSGRFLCIAYSSFKCAEYILFLSSVCPAVSCPAESVCLGGICQCFAGSYMVDGTCETGKD